MKRWIAALFTVSGLCLWWRYHQPQRARLTDSSVSLGGFKCAKCGMVGDSLDDFVPGGGVGFVSADRPMYTRDHGTITRDGTGL